MAFVFDTMTDTNGVALASHTGETGATWALHPNGVAGALIATNRVRGANLGSVSCLYYTSGTPASADYDVTADLHCASVLTGDITGVCGRMNTAANTYYFARYNVASTIWQLVKVVTGTTTVIGSGTTVALTAGVAYRVKLEMRGTAIKMYVNGVQVDSATDASIAAAGRAGLRFFMGSGGTSNSTGIHIDNFRADDAATEAAFVTAARGLGVSHLWLAEPATASGFASDVIGAAPGAYSADTKPGPKFGDGLATTIHDNDANAISTVPHNTNLNVGSTFTLFGWIRRTDRDQYSLFHKDTGAYSFLIDGSDKLRLDMWGTGTATTSTVNIDQSDWYFVAASVSAGSATLYQGQAKDWSVSATLTDVSGAKTTRALIDNTTQLYLGYFGFGGGFKGGARFWGIAPTALSKAQLETLYQSQKPYPTATTVNYGLHLDLNYTGSGADRTTRLNRADALNVSVARHSLPWDVVQGTDSSTFDWTRPDDIVTKSAALGIDPIFVFTRSPQWANGNADTQVVPGANAADGAFTTWQTAYTTWATAAVNRYKPSGTFGSNVTKWELWNEPNFGASWNRADTDTVDAAAEGQYVSWANAMRTAIVAAHAGASIAVGSLGSPNAVGAGSIKGETFLRDLVTGGLSTSFSIVSVHTYPSGTNAPLSHTNSDNNFDDLQRILDVLWDIGGTWASAAVWVTEFGWQGTAAGNTVPQDVGLANQATYLTTAHTQIRDRFSGQGVTHAIWFQDQDSTSQSYYHGLYTEPGAVKASATAYAAFLGGTAPEPGGGEDVESDGASGGVPRFENTVLISTADGDSFSNGYLRTESGAWAATTDDTDMLWEAGFRRLPPDGLPGFGPLVYELDGDVAYVQQGLARTSNGALAVTTTTEDSVKDAGVYRDAEKRLVVTINTES